MLLLYPLRHHAHGARVTRICAIIFLFPSLVSALIAQLLIIKNDVVLLSIARLQMVKIQFGFQISHNNIPIIIALNFLLLLLIFSLSHRKFVEYCSIASLSALFIFIIAATPDQLVRVSTLSIGTIVLSSIIFAQDFDVTYLDTVIKDFIINRLADLLAFTALIHVLLQFNVFITNEINLAENDIEFTHNFLFFASIMLRLISLGMAAKLPASSISATKFIIFYRLLLGIGAQLLLLFYAAPSAGTDSPFHMFMIMSALPVVVAFLASLHNKERIYSVNNISTLLLTANIVLILLGQRLIATMVLCLVVAIFPALSLTYTRKSIEPDTALQKTKLRQAILELLKRLIAPLRATIILMANFVVSFFGLIYAGLLLYRLPQFLLALSQMPLRFLNNGSVQRSLIFVVVMLIAYSYWWGES